MGFRLLGEVSLHTADGDVDLGTPKQRTVLAALLLAGGKSLSTETLADIVWGQTPPARWRNLLATYVSRLRHILDQLPRTARIQHRARGYALLYDEDLDVERFRSAVARARAAVLRDDDETAVALLGEALTHWHGDPLTGLTGDWVADTATRLHRERRDAHAARTGALLRLGRHDQAIDQLQPLAAEHPDDEQFVGQLITALHTAGRTAEALKHYHRLRQRLTDQLGVDPSPQLQQTYLGLLRSRTAHGLVLARPAQPPADAAGFTGRTKQLGALGTIIGELGDRVTAHPPYEAVVGQPVLTPQRRHGAAEAINLHVDTRRRLDGQQRTDPGPAIRDLDQPIGHAERNLASRLDRIAFVASALPIVPALLPPDVAGFTGREAELAELDDVTGKAGDRGRAAVTVVTGPAGAGKTATTVRWAHRNRPRFPDGQLFVDLRGFHPSLPPLNPRTVLVQLVRALGLDISRIPHDLQELAATYRSLLANRSLLVVLDNAATADQVRPLLPGSPGCHMLVTSRNRMDSLIARDGAHLVTLGMLTPADTRTLLTRLIGEARATAEPTSVRDLSRLCGRLPLALRLAAALLICRPHLPIRSLVVDLSDGDPLATLTAIDDPNVSVRAAFDLSYRALPPQPRLLFRRLGLVPGADCTAETAAALIASDESRAAAQLEMLSAAHLVQESAPGRFRLHDLLRRYAATLAETDETPTDREKAAAKLFACYLNATRAAAKLLYPHLVRLAADAGTSEPSSRFDDTVSAMRWLEAEASNLMAAIHHASEVRPPPAAWELADAFRGFLSSRAPRSDWLAAAHAGLAAAERVNHPRGQAAMTLSLGHAYRNAGNYRQAVAYATRSAALSRAAGWPRAEAAAISVLGLVDLETGRLSHAAEHFRRSIALHRRHGNDLGAANQLAHLGMSLHGLGRLREALRHQQTALAIHRRHGSLVGEAIALTGTGAVLRDLGRHGEANDCLTHARDLARQMGLRATQRIALEHLAALHRHAGNLQESLICAKQALALAADTRNAGDETGPLSALASIYRQLGDFRQAIDHDRQARTVAQALTQRHAMAIATVGMAASHNGIGDHRTAVLLSTEALRLARRHGYRLVEAHGLIVRAHAHLGTGRKAHALRAGTHAAQIFRECAHPGGEAAALRAIGAVHDA
jgi:DNA-binding SARP family transcriptional activator